MRFASAFFLITAWAPMTTSANAHSLTELEQQLGDREKYFQPKDDSTPVFSLRSADGESVRLAELQGKVVVLNFVYASCSDVCPLHMQRIAEVQSMVNRTPMKEQVRFLSIATDPNRDTPEILKGYGAAHGLDSINWTFLTIAPGQAEDVTRELAESFGHRFKRSQDGYQAHGVVTHVIDQQGRWRANFHGLQFAPVNLVMFINALINADHHQMGGNKKGLWDRMRGLLGND